MTVWMLLLLVVVIVFVVPLVLEGLCVCVDFLFTRCCNKFLNW